MNRTGPSLALLSLALLAAGAGGALLAAAFSGWIEHGSAIFLSLAESGLAWCL
ncbi:hypothetical protein KYK29_02555 [Shinella daejeonensis]|uniref:hypothetical protein n=1 Tax=Shinella daejeonensis TaxID=659017 RepID=UPI0020C7F452|nr:hypothetical protein [Shinella daejeonensis]MCP8893795.1 hypothetical protein [Shinella daejeonensis]